jgi:hypothetical protein
VVVARGEAVATAMESRRAGELTGGLLFFYFFKTIYRGRHYNCLGKK